ncbi:hypothetical protein AXF24_12340 [Streptococcus pneumoniae]|uniref:hypothetical protein n=1 Tax=Streptococcus pneumoniae TaxID=1313 RepID=UPI0007723FFC|nr:hypothetical protein AWW74_12355 [Streptococcus pneumoniae]KXB94866.1 hypothetical protein AXF24_12340 [Streptococcus pneumoniae]
MLTQWADMIGFLHEPIAVVKNKDEKMSRGIDGRQGRVLEINRSPAWLAKNRYGLTNSISIPRENGWNYLAEQVYKSCNIDLYNRAINVYDTKTWHSYGPNTDTDTPSYSPRLDIDLNDFDFL